jgi:hypothetical protein
MTPRRHIHTASALTYRYPRTTTEAFGCDATSAVAAWHCKPARSYQVKKMLDYMTAAAIGCGLVWAVLEWWTT